jgi:hypothetical protein
LNVSNNHRTIVFHPSLAYANQDNHERKTETNQIANTFPNKPRTLQEVQKRNTK